MLLPTLSLCVGAYLLGSISSAIIVCKLFKLPDPRKQGSKNPGATNVLRLGGKKKAAIVLIFDVLKGVVPVLIGHKLGLTFAQLGFVGFAAILGHVFPIYYQFKGGKGVATFLGMLYAVNWLFGLVATGIWLLVLWLSSYSSLSSMVMVIVPPFLSATMLGGHHAFLPLLLCAVVILIKHKGNMQRLVEGQESKTNLFGKGKKAKS